MGPLEVLLLACGLAVDSCLVALAHGLKATRRAPGTALRIGAIFGGLQGAMAALGWFVGAPVANSIARLDHWIAFAALAAIGVKTIREGYAQDEGARDEPTLGRLLAAGFATSIDALVAGFGLRLIDQPIAPAAIATAAVTALGSAFAYRSSLHLGRGSRAGAHWVAGLVLIGLGASILVEHSDHF